MEDSDGNPLSTYEGWVAFTVPEDATEEDVFYITLSSSDVCTDFYTCGGANYIELQINIEEPSSMVTYMSIFIALLAIGGAAFFFLF